MKILYALLLIISLSVITGLAIQQEQPDRSKIALAIERSMKKELLDAWYPRCIDREFGGFLSTFTHDFRPTEDQDKMIVTQARHVWSNAKASQLFPDIGHYKTSAKQGFDFLHKVMWDRQYGGFHTLVDRQGNVKSRPGEEKTAYGNSFGIYALAAYYEASGDTSALALARKAFLWLEKHSHDPVHKGYYQHMNMDGTLVIRESTTPSTAETGYKDQNSSIHLLEAFTALYTVWPDPLLKERLMEMLFLIRDTITTPKGYLTLFFSPDWKPVSFHNASESVILKHRGLDHVSFGHDVETAYLLLEASHALGLEDDTRTMTVAKRMVDHALENGWDDIVGGFYDEGYYFKGDKKIRIIRDTKNWWAQAEGLNTLLLMADHFPDDKHQYFDKFRKLWAYIDTYLIDHKHGEWYQGGLDKDPKQKNNLKGHIWKASYHQFRSLANCVMRLRPDTEPPAAPSNLMLSKSANGAALKWDSASDNGRLLGYYVFQDDKKIGFTPNTEILAQWIYGTTGRSISVRSVDLHGNLSADSNTVMF